MDGRGYYGAPPNINSTFQTNYPQQYQPIQPNPSQTFQNSNYPSPYPHINPNSEYINYHYNYPPSYSTNNYGPQYPQTYGEPIVGQQPSQQLNDREVIREYDLETLTRVLLEGEDPSTISFSGMLKNEHLLSILEKTPVNLQLKNSGGQILLHVAASQGQVAIVKTILGGASFPNRTVNIDERDIHGRTALHWACTNYQLPIIDMLLGYGANPKSVNEKGDTPLHYLVRGTSTSQEAYISVLKQIQEKGADINAKNVDGETPFHLACSYGNIDAVRFLVMAGADVTATNNLGETGVNYAMKMNPEMGYKILAVLNTFSFKDSLNETTELQPTQPSYTNYNALYPPLQSSQYGVEYAPAYPSPPPPSTTSSQECVQSQSTSGGPSKVQGQYPTTPAPALPFALGPSLSTTLASIGSTLADINFDLTPNTNTQNIGQVGSTPKDLKAKYPIVIIPGLCSSALEAWQSNAKNDNSWFRSRVWISVQKLGNKKKNWLEHLILEDGWRDPPGIKLRPVEGLHGIDFLASGMIIKEASYVFSYMIENLAMVGYDNKNLTAAPYDWRIPMCKLEERDSYFSRLKHLIESTHVANNEKVVLLAHSMGNRVVHYFLNWVKSKYSQSWIDEHIQMHMAVGAPFLGAPKALRGSISGDKFGLDLFLSDDESIRLCRAMGSVPTLFPLLGEVHNLPQFSLVRNEGESNFERVPEKEIVTQSGAGKVWEFYEKYYVNDEHFLKKKSHNDTPPILLPPPVKNLVCIYGINLKTECVYFYKKNKLGIYSLDTNASEKHLGLTKQDLSVKGGIGYETPTTLQASCGRRVSGDGTVPFSSLNYPQVWKDEKKEGYPNITIHEIHGADHRDMLSNPKLFDIIVQYVTGNVRT